MLKITKNQGSIQVTADKSGFYPFDGTITFPTNSLFTATSANTDMITFKSTSNGDVQFVGNYKDITISGRSYDTKQKFLTAFSNLANQGSVDAYTKAETDAKLNDKLTAQTNANGALFISSSSNDDANNSVALYNSIVKGSKDVAIQLASTPDKEGMHNLAILSLAEANGIQNIAIGAFQRCKGISNIGIGVGASDPNTVDVNGQGNVCIGASSQAHTASNTAVNNSIAIGVGASASSNFCTVIGNSANSKSSHAVAVGDNAYVDHDCDSSVAVGNSARAYGKNSVAIGCTSYADNDKPLDICCGKKDNNEVLSVLQSDATGKISVLKGDGTDTRMVIQDEIEALKNAGGSGGETVDAYTKAETDTKLDAKQDKLTAGSGITITKDETAGTSTIATAVSLTDNGNGAYQVGDSIKMGDGIAIGSSATSPSAKSIAIGNSANINPDDIESVAIGYKANAAESYSVAIGSNTTASKSYGVGIGYKCKTDINSVAIGRTGLALGNGSVAIGSDAQAGNGGVGVGTVANASGGNSVAIGYKASASNSNCVAIGYWPTATTNMPLVIKAGANTRGVALPMIQGDKVGKISIPLGDGTLSTMCIQDEIAALKAEIAALKGGASTGA